MTTVAHIPGANPGIDTEAARIARTVRSEAMLVALAANAALLDNPPNRIYQEELDAGDWSFSYVRSPQARWLWIRWVLGPGTGTATVDLTVRDAAGASVASSSSSIPLGFKGETQRPVTSVTIDRFQDERVIEGHLDLDTLDDTLTDPTWSLDLTVTVTGAGYVSRFEALEVPRFEINDAIAARGTIPSTLQPGRAITDGATDGLDRLLATIEGGRTTQRTYLLVAWLKTTAVTTPYTTSTSFVPFTAAEESAGVSLTWEVLVRRVLAASAVGERCRFRVLYRFSGGAGTETGKVQVLTGSSSSPFATSALAYTTSWTWGAWVECNLITTASPLFDTIALKGWLSAAGPTLHVAGLHVQENAS